MACLLAGFTFCLSFVLLLCAFADNCGFCCLVGFCFCFVTVFVLVFCADLDCFCFRFVVFVVFVLLCLWELVVRN